MAGLTVRGAVVGGLLLIVGVASSLMLTRSGQKVDERWMEDNSLTSFGQFQMISSPDNPRQSYRMDERSYELLKPFGIVSRVFESGPERFDVVLIASDNKESFHDPTVCFPGQGWQIVEERTDKIDTKTRGQIPISIVKMRSPQGESKLSAYFYRAKAGFFPRTGDMSLGMFIGPLKGNFDTNGVFYRFMPISANVTEERLKAFMVEYMDASYEKSNGFF